MTRAIWGDNLRLSVPQMDREHAGLIALANEFSAALDAGASRAELEIRVTQMIEGFGRHFRSEEGLMQSEKYPGLESHTQEHARLIGQMIVLRDGLGSGGINLGESLADFVRLWTEQHIKGPDTGFANFLHEEEARRRPSEVLVGR